MPGRAASRYSIVRRRTRLAAVAPLWVCAVLALGQQQEKTVVRLRVNQEEKADIVVLVSASDLLIRVPDLRDAGLRGFAGERQTIADELYVSLPSLAPAVSYTLNDKELTLDITARDDLLAQKVLDLGAPHPSGIEYTQDTSAFLNYALTERVGEPFSIAGETGISLGGPLLTSSFSQLGGRFTRGLTSLTLDEREHLRRWIIGDTPPNSVSAAGGLPLLGISVSRNFNLDPYFIRFPGFGISTTVDTPSTLEVYMNGRLVHQEQVPPGQLDLRNLPAVHGNGSVELVLRDAFGRERRIVSQFYLATRILGRGISEYSYNVGFVRRQTGPAMSSYGPLAILASHRTGVSDRLTAGFHLEALGGLFNAGPSIAARLPLGEIEISAAGSTLDGRPGAAALLTYSYVGHSIGFGALARARSIHSPSFDLTSTGTPPLDDTNLFLSRPIGSRATMSLQYGVSRLPRMPWARTFSFLSSTRITSRINLVVTARWAADVAGQAGSSAFVGLNYVIGPRTNANAGLQFDGNGAASSLQLTRSLPPVGNGFGYRLQQLAGPSNQMSGLVQYQGPYGRYEGAFNNVGGASSTSFTAAGSIVAIGGRLDLAQPVQDGFGLLRLPGLSGVRGYVENQPVGRTDSHGDLIIPALLSYYGNRVTIDPEQIPVNSDIGSTEKLVAPPYRAGALISFPVQTVQVITGNLIVDAAGKSIVPSYGDLSVILAGKAMLSPIGKQGEFYFENLAAGRYLAKLQGGDQDCEFTLIVPGSSKPFLNLGAVQCLVH